MFTFIIDMFNNKYYNFLVTGVRAERSIIMESEEMNKVDLIAILSSIREYAKEHNEKTQKSILTKC